MKNETIGEKWAGSQMKNEVNGKNNFSDPADVMLLLAKEADDVIAMAGKSAMQESAAETEKILQQYEQRSKQVILKIREETRARADEMSARFRDALILCVEEASTAALDKAAQNMSTQAGEIVRRLKESVQKDTRQALADGLVAVDSEKSRPAAPATKPAQEKTPPMAEPPAPEEISLVYDENGLVSKATEDFEKWLMQ
jgi:hypothetical protein